MALSAPRRGGCVLAVVMNDGASACGRGKLPVAVAVAHGWRPCDGEAEKVAATAVVAMVVARAAAVRMMAAARTIEDEGASTVVVVVAGGVTNCHSLACGYGATPVPLALAWLHAPRSAPMARKAFQW